MNKHSAVKSFAMTNMLLEADLDKIEEFYSIDLGRNDNNSSEIEEIYYPQFDVSLRKEAKRMSAHYEVFYCLEKSIRQLIIDIFEGSENEDWWDNLIPDQIKAQVKQNIKHEEQSAVTPRSTEPIDYTTFGQLGEIIKANWSLFGGTIFNDMKAMVKVMSDLNSLRNPIAHCSPLAEDEVLRLNVSLRDWFRLVG